MHLKLNFILDISFVRIYLGFLSMFNLVGFRPCRARLVETFE